MAQTPKKPTRAAQPNAPARPLTKRGMTRLQRERQRQRRIVIATATAIGLAVIAILSGVLYDRVWIPSRPVAQVADMTLSRGDYWAERRNTITNNLAQNLQLLRLFGDQAAQQFAGQTAQLEAQVPSIRTAPVDEQTVSGWIDQQVIAQGAAQESIQASDGDIAQTLVGDLNRVFPPPPPIITDTSQLTSTDALTDTGATTGTDALTGTDTLTGTASAATPTTAPTATPEPTITADAALPQEDAVIERVYDAYRNQITAGNAQVKPNLALEDFDRALKEQYQRRVLTDKVQAKLIPESSFTASEEPSSITVRHILVKVDLPENASEAESNTLFDQAKARADGLLLQLRDGTNFEELAKQKSDDGATKASGGTLPSFDPTGKTQDNTQIDPSIVAAAAKLQKDEISDLVKTPFGWDIVQLVERKVDSKEAQLSRARTEAFDKWVAAKRAALNVQQFPPQTPTATPAPTSETAAPLPTVNLAGTTEPLTDTGTLTSTEALTDTGTLTDTQILPTLPPVPASTTAPLTDTGTLTDTGALPTLAPLPAEDATPAPTVTP